MRKEEILVGTRKELEDFYYNGLNIKPRGTDIEIGNVEFMELNRQIESFKDGFGILCWLQKETSSSSLNPTEVETNVNLVLKKTFVLLQDEKVIEKVKELWKLK